MAAKKKSVSDAMPAFAVRIERVKIVKAMAMGIDIPRLFRGVLDRELSRREGKCPTCGTGVSVEKK